MRAQGHLVFSGDRYDLNIVGIRSANSEANRFDDLITVFWRRADAWCQFVCQATTDPGRYWLEHPMGVSGTAILKPGQYRGAFRLGLHQGHYPALVQAAPLTVIRDANRDDRLDTTGPGTTEDVGMFGINLHHAAAVGESTQVDKWSAGCQVTAAVVDHDVLMALCRAAVPAWGDTYTYTLLDERDFGLLA